MNTLIGQSNSRNRIPALDGVRGLAILLVLVWHTAPFIPDAQRTVGAYIAKALQLSWSGVDLFFVLSGFLIGGILLDQRGTPNYFSVFYVRRFFRIVPLYVVVLLVNYTAHVGQPVAPFPLPWYAFAQNIWMALHGTWNISFAISWSLAVEEQFYLMFPLLIWFFPRRAPPPAFVVLALLAPIIRIAIYSVAPEQQVFVANHVLFPCRMDALALGALCAIWVRNDASSQWAKEHQKTLHGIFFAFVLAAAAMTLLNGGLNTAFMTTVGYTILAMLYASLILIVVTNADGLFAHVMRWRPFCFLGSLAYCLYLIHGTGTGYAIRFGDLGSKLTTVTDWLIYLAGLMCAIALARLSWIYFERPLIRIGHAFRYSNLLAARPSCRSAA